MTVWVVIYPESDLPIAGIWQSMEAAAEHCPTDYVLLKVELDTDLTTAPQ